MLATSSGEPAALIQDSLYENEDNLPQEEMPSKGAEDSSSGTGTPSSESGTLHQEAEDSSSGLGTPSSEAGTLPQGAGNSSPGSTPSILPGDATAASPGVKPSPSIRVAPDAPHHEAASTRSNLSVEETFDSTHAKGESGADLPATDLDFTILDLPGTGE